MASCRFAFLTFAGEAIYPTYIWAPRIIGLDSLNDQILGGIIMKIVNMGFSLTILGTCFYFWARSKRKMTPSSNLLNLKTFSCRPKPYYELGDIFCLGLLLFAIASFIWERIPPDLTSITVFGVLLFTAMLSEGSELPSLQVLLDVFSNPAPITIAGMFIVSAALERTGAVT